MMVSIIVLNHDTPEYTRRCLEAVYQLTRGVEFEVFVVDNGSRNDDMVSVLSGFPEVRFLKSESNLGFSRGNNLAVPYTSGNYLALLNSDAFLLNDAFSEICSYMDAHPKCGIAGAQLVSESGEVQQSVFKAPTALTQTLKMILRDKYVRVFKDEFRVGSFDYHVTRRVFGGVSGACMVVRREIAENDVLLDPHFFFYLEDVDLCYTSMEKGWEIHYCPSAKVAHVGGVSLNEESVIEGVRRKELYWRSVIHFFNKHYSAVHSAALRKSIGTLFALNWISRWLMAKFNRSTDARVKCMFSRRVTVMLLRNQSFPELQGPNRMDRAVKR